MEVESRDSSIRCWTCPILNPERAVANSDPASDSTAVTRDATAAADSASANLTNPATPHIRSTPIDDSQNQLAPCAGSRGHPRASAITGHDLPSRGSIPWLSQDDLDLVGEPCDSQAFREDFRRQLERPVGKVMAQCRILNKHFQRLAELLRIPRRSK